MNSVVKGIVRSAVERWGLDFQIPHDARKPLHRAETTVTTVRPWLVETKRVEQTTKDHVVKIRAVAPELNLVVAISNEETANSVECFYQIFRSVHALSWRISKNLLCQRPLLHPPLKRFRTNGPADRLLIFGRIRKLDIELLAQLFTHRIKCYEPDT